MDDDLVAESITAGRIAGESECDTCVEDGACLRGDVQALRDFVDSLDPNLFYYDDKPYLESLIRTDDGPGQ